MIPECSLQLESRKKSREVKDVAGAISAAHAAEIASEKRRVREQPRQQKAAETALAQLQHKIGIHETDGALGVCRGLYIQERRVEPHTSIKSSQTHMQN